MKYLFPLLALFILGMGACKNQQQNSSNPKERTVAGLQWTEVASGNYCAVETEGQQLIRSAEEWAALWQNMQSMIDPVPPLPEVNFDQQVLLACFMGTRSSGGYSVEVAGMEQKENLLQVRLLYKEPGKNCVATMALTQPYTVVAVEVAGVEAAEFSMENRTYDCDK